MPYSFIQAAETFAAESGIAFEIDDRLADVDAGPVRLLIVGRGKTSLQVSMLRDIEVIVDDAEDATSPWHWTFEKDQICFGIDLRSLPEPIRCSRQTTGSVEKTILVHADEDAAKIKDTGDDSTNVEPEDDDPYTFEMLRTHVTATLYAMMHHSLYGSGSDGRMKDGHGMGWSMNKVPPMR